MDIIDLWFPPITIQLRSLQPSLYRGQLPSHPQAGEKLDISNRPDEGEALHLCNHRQLVPSDYEALNAILRTVAHCNR